VVRAKDTGTDKVEKSDSADAAATVETAAAPKDVAPQDAADSGQPDTKDSDRNRGDAPGNDGKPTGRTVTETMEPTGKRGHSRWVGFFALIAGGVLAALAGYGAAQYMPRGWPIYEVPDPTADLRKTVDAHERDLSGLLVRMAELDGTAAEVAESRESLTELKAALRDIEIRLAGSESRSYDGGVSQEALDALEGRIAGLAGRVGDIETRFAALEVLSADGGISPDAMGALEDRLAGLAEQVGEIEASGADREDAARAAMRRAALSRIRAALDSGTGFVGAIADLNEVGATDVPPILVRVAESGVATESELRNSFPEAARAALAAETEAAVADGRMTRLNGFLRRQFGVRSVRPREGTDADAILSRTEAALREGDMATGLEELRALPPAAADAMRDWIVGAETRRNALEAAARFNLAPDGG